MRYLVLVLLTGCADFIDPTMNCHPAVTRGGMAYDVCSMVDGSAFVRTDYGDVDCVQGRHGGPDCVRTAEIFLGGVSECIQDWSDAMYAWDWPAN